MTRLGAALLSLCLLAMPASGQTVTAGDGAVVNTGPGNAVKTGDNSTVIIGYTIEQHEAALARREARIRDDLNRVSSLEQELLRRQIADIEGQRANLQASYDQAVRELTDLRNRLSDIGEGIPQQKIDEAKQALYEGDRSKADALFAEVEAMEQESIDRAAAAAFERGKIAEQEIRWHDAAQHYEKAAKLGDDPHYLLKAGWFLWRAGEFRHAVRYEEDYLEAMIATHGDEAAEVATAMTNLAVSYHAMGRYDEAEPLYRQAIEIDKVTIGETHPEYATHLNNLALLLRTMSRYDEAEPLYRQAMEITKAALGETHPDYAIDLNNLANLLRATGRLDEAEPLFRQAIEIDKATVGEMHPGYATRLNNLAGLLRAMGRYGEAEPLIRQAIEIDKTTIGETHPDYATHLNNLAGLLKQMNRLDEARPLLAEAVEVRKSALGDNHPDTLASVWWQADFARADGDFAASKEYYAQVLSGFQTSLGTDHPRTNQLAQQFGSLLRAHFPDDPALAELEATFGPDIGK